MKEGLIEWQVVDKGAPSFETLVDEVEYALFPPKHEGEVPTYGCVVLEKAPSSEEADGKLKKVSREMAREMADGIASFAVVGKSKYAHVALFASANDEESRLIELANKWKGFLVHRNGKGVVRVFAKQAIHIYEAGEWLIRPHAESVVSDVITAAPQVIINTLDGMLELAFHALSPANVGTTLVLCLKNAKAAPADGIDLSSLGLNVCDKTHIPAIRSLLCRHDGAVFVAPDGKLLSMGHHLQNSERSREIIPKVGGTRHTSAKRFTFDEPRVIAVVVSEDGPVSVFSDGAKVTELNQTFVGGTASYLASLVPEKAQDVETYITPEECPKCGKHLEVEVVIIYGLREPETGECPVCGETVYRKSCWQIIPRLVKRLPSK
ncbi:MAG: DNA integrity scanning protein DisA nucleotide-binding domain protein [Planctomycetes bacterium]|nr:DNA integrity scanning protein DisA nucleotide-binding domain protein [Planctomycetota bacterium]